MNLFQLSYPIKEITYYEVFDKKGKMIQRTYIYNGYFNEECISFPVEYSTSYTVNFFVNQYSAYERFNVTFSKEGNISLESMKKKSLVPS